MDKMIESINDGTIDLNVIMQYSSDYDKLIQICKDDNVEEYKHSSLEQDIKYATIAEFDSLNIFKWAQCNIYDMLDKLVLNNEKNIKIILYCINEGKINPDIVFILACERMCYNVAQSIIEETNISIETFIKGIIIHAFKFNYEIKKEIDIYFIGLCKNDSNYKKVRAITMLPIENIVVLVAILTSVFYSSIEIEKLLMDLYKKDIDDIYFSIFELCKKNKSNFAKIFKKLH